MVDTNFLMLSILKGMFLDKNYAFTVTTVFEEKYFQDVEMSEIFRVFKKHLDEHKEIPSKDIVANSIPSDTRAKVIDMLSRSEQTDFDMVKNYDWLLTETNNFLKDAAIKNAILQSVEVIDEKGNTSAIRDIIENALCKDIKINLGLDYFATLGERITRILTTADNRVQTYYPSLDEIFNGGYPPYTLNLMIAKPHGHKSNIMTNIITRQVYHGVDVAMASLEMSEDMYAQRFDANFTNLDINRIYHNKSVRGKFVSGIKELKNNTTRGNLFIKEYPTGRATVLDFRIWLRELKMRDMMPKIFYCDYLSLMKPEGKHTGDLYKDGKAISEDLRALGLEFGIPVVTVAQINRTGTFLDFYSLDMNSIGESFGVPATADSMLVQGADEDDMIYKNELKWKCVKNRLGGQVGRIGKWYYDEKSLRIYDETELDLWIENASHSGDARDMKEETVTIQPNRQERKKRS